MFTVGSGKHYDISWLTGNNRVGGMYAKEKRHRNNYKRYREGLNYQSLDKGEGFKYITKI